MSVTIVSVGIACRIARDVKTVAIHIFSTIAEDAPTVSGV